MSAFDTIGDAAHSLRTEGQEIKLAFKQGVPATGQGTVEWTIPTPAHGCASGETGAYAGIVILLSTEPLDASNIPQDGKVYVADQTADFDLSTADRIGNAIVIGAVYECEQKASGSTLTTSIIINDLIPNTAYYVGGYATDCQFRYHAEGIRAYSDSYGEKDGTSIAAIQVIDLGLDQAGILPSDGTGLLPGANYKFDVIVDNSFPNGYDFHTINFDIDGLNAGTYQDLINEIVKQTKLYDNPPQSPLAPHTNDYYWNPTEEILYQYDGVQYNTTPALIEPTDPTNVVENTYWYNPDTKALQQYAGSPLTWINVNFLESESDPNSPEFGLYWFDNTIARRWDGYTWCNRATTISTTDPSLCPVLEGGSYWFNETASTLLNWNIEAKIWESVTAPYWSEAPNAMSDGTYWYDDAVNKLFLMVAGAWSDITANSAIQDTTPLEPVDGMVWYQPSVEQLSVYNGSPLTWTAVDVLVWPEDPTTTESCSLWWSSLNDNLYVWDIVNNEWDIVTRFTSSTVDPSLAQAFAVDDVWYNSDTSLLYSWTGGDWNLENHIEQLTDPNILVEGEGWFNPTTNVWKIWGTPTGFTWNDINPVDSINDPTIIPAGILWFDTTTTALFVYNGVSWGTVTFSTIPYVPVRKSKWFNTSTDILYEWETSWVEVTPEINVFFNTAGGITFQMVNKGSDAAILVPVPPDSLSAPQEFSNGFADFSEFDVNPVTQYTYERNTSGRIYTARIIDDSVFLWSSLKFVGIIREPEAGNDGKSGLPSYATLGVGDDGTPDERRELMDSIRSQLGYPVVDVELTNYQLDTAIQGALESFRKRSGAATRRGFFFVDIEPQKQHYLMTNKGMGYNKIVNIMAAHRFTSAFLSSAHGSGVYGQVVLQHLYNMGTFDLTSFHLVSQYVEQLEQMFATRLTYTFHEHDRILSFFNSFTRPERVLLDCMVERTEQDLMKDRYTKSWIERYALSEAMFMLAHIRGKFASLPGAGGGISLNADTLITLAQSYRDELIQQIEEYVVDTPEEVGMMASFILG